MFRHAQARAIMHEMESEMKAILVNRVYTKRETAKSAWSGRVGSVELAFTSKSEIVVTLDGKELPDVSVQHLVNFALQTLQDAYAGADDLAEAQANWEKKRAKLYDGTIGTRGEGSAMTDEERAELHVAELAYRRKYGKDSDEGKAFAALEDTTEFLEGIAEKLRTGKNAEQFAADVAARVAHVVAQRKLNAEKKAGAAAYSSDL